MLLVANAAMRDLGKDVVPPAAQSPDLGTDSSSNRWLQGVIAEKARSLTGNRRAKDWVPTLASPLITSQDFINITDPIQRKDRKIQKLVRVKAQRHVRKCQKHEQHSIFSSPEALPKSGPVSSRDSLSPQGQLTLRDPDVPESYPIQMQPYMCALLDRCKSPLF